VPEPVPVPLPTDFSALPPAGPTGVRLMVAAQGITEVDLDTGVRRPVTGVPASGSGYRLDRTDGGAVIVQFPPACRGCAHSPYLVPAGSLAAVHLPGYDGAAAAADRLAWVPDECTFDCTVTVTDLPGGPDRRYELHAAGLGVCATFFPTGFGQCAAFSPDGASLAVIAHRDVAGAGGLPARVAYLLTGGAVTRIGIRSGVMLPDISLALGWSGRRLVLATAGPSTRVRQPPLLLA